MLAIGWIAVALAAAGAVLPLLPTTPFLLVAAWAFGRSSERLRRWLYNNKLFGPLLQSWQKYGAVPIWAKVMAVGTMALAFYGILQRGNVPDWVVVLIGVSLAAVSVWLVSRPSGPQEK
jgi:uncharacterized membrane protein YbaN (DUF454 family)